MPDDTEPVSGWFKKIPTAEFYPAIVSAKLGQVNGLTAKLREIRVRVVVNEEQKKGGLRTSSFNAPIF